MKRHFLLLILMSVAQLALAQTNEPPTLVTDRPDQTESTVVVPVQYLQIETGPRYTRVDETVSEFVYSNTMLRYGVLSWLELRLGQDYGRQRYALDGGEREYEGFFPLMLGTKVHLLEERGLVPATALLYEAQLPTGSRALRPEETTHTIRGLFSYTLSDWVDLGYNLGVVFPNEQDRVSTVYTVSFAFKMTDKLTALTEVYGFLVNEEQNQHAFDGGFTYLLRPNLQLDLLGGAGLSEAADDGFVTAGLSWRIPR